MATISTGSNFRRRSRWGSARQRRESIAAAAYRLHQPIMAAALERHAQTPDMHVDRALLHEDMVAPHLVEQLRAAVNAFRMRHEKMQQAKFRRTHFQLEIGRAH